MKKNVWTMSVAGALVVVLAVYTVCFTVQAGTAGAVYTLGAITAIREKPGFYLKWPWPFQSVKTVDTRIRLLDVVGNTNTTRDEFNILVTLSAGWKVRRESDNVKRFLTVLENVSQAEKAVRDELVNARQSLVQQIRLGDIISTDPKQRERYERFETDLRKAVQSKLDKAGYGLDISFVKVKQIAFDKTTTEKVFKRMINERKRRSEAYVQDGKDKAQQIKDNATLKKEKMLSQARAEATKIRGQGDAAAAEYYKVFKKNPELANFLRRLDALRNILSKRSTVVLPGKNTLDEYLIEQPPGK